MTKKSIKTSIKKHTYKSGQIVYTGYITAYNESKISWSKSSCINRLTFDDAMKDAEYMKKRSIKLFSIINNVIINRT